MNLEEWKKFISSINILDINNKKSTDSYARLINQMEHCIGMDYRKPYKRNGVMYYKPYRNHYDTVDEMWDALVEIGYAYKNRMYHLTLSGIGWLSCMNGTFIYNPCAESEFDTYKEVFKFFCKMDFLAAMVAGFLFQQNNAWLIYFCHIMRRKKLLIGWLKKDT